MKIFTKLLTTENRRFGLWSTFLFLTSLMSTMSGDAQVLFSQDFNSSTTLSNYISASSPNSGQFNAISTSGTNTASVSTNALRFTRGNGTSSFTRSTNFSTTPTVMIYRFDLTVSGTSSGNSNGAARWQIGNNFSTTNAAESDSNTYAKMLLDFRGTSNFRFDDDTNNTTSSNFSVGTTYAITWVMNNSGSTLSYLGPNGTTETITNDDIDFWVGNTLVFDDKNVETTGGSINDMKFVMSSGTGTITMDDISVQVLTIPQVSGFLGNTICGGAVGQLTATTSAGVGPFTIVYNDGTANRTATGVTSGVAFDVFTDPSVTTNYTLISIADSSTGIRTSGFSDSAATITVSAPTVGIGSALSAICQGGTSAGLGGSFGGTATGATWSDGGIGGAFNPNANTLNATWTPPVGFSGPATLTLTTSGGSCGTTSAGKTQVVNASSTASAGGTQTICPLGTATVSGASATGSIVWTENGAGSITSGSTTLTPTYTAAAGDAGNTVTLTMTVTNSPCSVATATYTVIVSPAAPAAPGAITGSTSVCAGATLLTYSIAAVTNATDYTWTVPAGWNITAGQGSTTITATAGGSGLGEVTVVASNFCGSNSPTTNIDIFPANGTNNTGFVTSSVKTSGSLLCSTSQRGYAKFPLTSIPAGATITAATLTLVHTGTDTNSSADNDVKPLGNTDVLSASASTIYNAIGSQNSGTNYSSSIWSNSGTVALTLNSNAIADIQSRFDSPGYLTVGLSRGGSATYTFNGYAGGTNAPKLSVSYTTPRSLSVTINPSTTNGDLTISACDSYTWAENGTTYTSTGIYTHVVGCNTATLNLTITPSTTNGSVTTSVCDTYTWPSNGQTYTSTGVYTHVVGCNTATLNLTVTPSTTAGSLTTSVCDTYTWAENGATYTSSGVYTHVVGCNTATLDLTVTPSTTIGSVTTSVCDTYTWPSNGQTYTSTGVYTNVVGCNTATLNLTVTPSTTAGSLTTSVCDTYTWAENGSTYTSSGVYTHVVGCNTATLDLTVTPSTTIGSVTTSVCDTYTWPSNGQTYTSTGVYTNVVGCNTATLDLTVTPSTNNGSLTETACVSYTWAENGETYTSSGVYTHTVGCNTAVLNLTVNTSPQTFYADTDGDGFGAGSAILSCTGQPVNTSVNNTDCAPADPLKWRMGNLFIDTDGDTYNNGFPAAPVCYGASVPAGYITINYGTDCDDNLATTNSNASEIPGNEIDDNCDGTVDEVTPTSYLAPVSCGATLTSLSSPIYAYQLASFPEVGTVQAYRFRVTNGGNVRTFDSPTSSFNLTNLAGGAVYGTTYTVAVSVKTGGYFRAYGTDCTVSTPAIPNATNIASPACGSTLVSISATIYCNAAPGASGYRFRVSDGGSVIGIVDTSVNRFSLTSIAGIQFGTTYQIDVLLAYGGQLRPESEYGPACSISTPATPGTSRVTSPSCGSSISSFYTTIYAQQVIGAQGYKFVVTNGAQTREFATPFSRFTLRNLIGGAAPSTTYTIRVDVLYNASYVQGLVTCDITTTAGATRSTANALDIYEVKAYPNPYAETFKLDVNTSSEGQVGVRVYDMLGREVESREASVDNITNLEIGSQYPSGVYNIIVTQGDNVKTLRVIKR